MAQQMPVVRQLHWPGLLPQLAAVVFLATLACAVFRNLHVPLCIALAALVCLVFCRSMRAALVRHHTDGMRAYRDQKFAEAITHFEASYRFFSTHPRLDAWRSLLFGVACANPYRVIALCNVAYCHAQLGDGPTAMKFYEQALQEKPDCKLAQASLNMLHSASRPPHSPPPLDAAPPTSSP